MKALNKLSAKLNRPEVEEDTARVAVPEFQIPIVRVKDQPRKHKVISYGLRVLVDDEVPDAYRFQYLPDPDQPEELHPGVIPENFQAGVPVDDTMVYFHTRRGVMGPEYSVVYHRPDPEGGEPLYTLELPWEESVDQLWVDALVKFEEEAMLSEDAMSFLDADPLWLFGIADPATQRALEKSDQVPMLQCMGARPCLAEWFAYLNADEKGDGDYTWVVESFAEVELPQPWTSYKGAGNAVCYWNTETNDTTWKHPFYDYFAQLLNHCRRSTEEEHVKLRINRVLWAYEAESASDVAHQMPLVSPKHVKQLADILRIDLVDEPFMVRSLKKFLKAFSMMYHEGDLDTQEVKWCMEVVQNERNKYATSKAVPHEEDPAAMLDSPQPGHMYCVECSIQATCYCPECGDLYCEGCFERIHMKGNRAFHEPNHFILCAMCKVFPAKLQCTYTRGKYCIDCYMNKHKKTLPKFLDLQPLPIDYRRSIKDNAENEGTSSINAAAVVMPEDKDSFSKGAPLETTLGERWHAFYDLRGVKYYYNFETQESMRRPQDSLLGAEDPKKAAATALGAKPFDKEAKLGQIAMSKAPRLLQAWAEGKEEMRD